MYEVSKNVFYVPVHCINNNLLIYIGSPIILCIYQNKLQIKEKIGKLVLASWKTFHIRPENVSKILV